MKTDEFAQLTRASIRQLLQERSSSPAEECHNERRREPRWSFPSTVELWVTDETGNQDYLLARSLDLSGSGIGVLVDVPLAPDQEITIALHEPEMTLYGTAIVRHCAHNARGYRVGLEFCL